MERVGAQNVLYIMVTFNSSRTVEKALDCLGDAMAEGPSTVVVVDSGSDDETQQLVESRSWCRFERTPRNLGYAAAVNHGVNIADQLGSAWDYAFVLNPDVYVTPDAVQGVLGVLSGSERIGCCGPRLVYPDQSPQYGARRFPRPFDVLANRTPNGFLREHLTTYYLMKSPCAEPVREADWLLGACFAVSRSAWQASGGMDERYFLYFEDVDFCRSLWRCGYSVAEYVDSSVVHDHQRASTNGRALGIHLMSYARYLAKWRSRGLFGARPLVLE